MLALMKHYCVEAGCLTAWSGENCAAQGAVRWSVVALQRPLATSAGTGKVLGTTKHHTISISTVASCKLLPEALKFYRVKN